MIGWPSSNIMLLSPLWKLRSARTAVVLPFQDLVGAAASTSLSPVVARLNGGELACGGFTFSVGGGLIGRAHPLVTVSRKPPGMKRRVLIGTKFSSRMIVASRRALLVVGSALSRSSSAA